MNTAVHPAYNWLEAILSTVGAAIAGTLWWAHRANVELPCSTGGGCGLVNASRWSHLTLGPLHQVPVALLGLLTYLTLLALALAKFGAESERTRRLLHAPLWAVSLFGAGYSWYLQYVAHFEIGAFCIYCFSSATVMTLLAATATAEGLRRARSAPSTTPTETRPAAHV